MARGDGGEPAAWVAGTLSQSPEGDVRYREPPGAEGEGGEVLLKSERDDRRVLLSLPWELVDVVGEGDNNLGVSANYWTRLTQPNWVSWYQIGGTLLFPVSKTLVQEIVWNPEGKRNRDSGTVEP